MTVFLLWLKISLRVFSAVAASFAVNQAMTQHRPNGRPWGHWFVAGLLSLIALGFA